MKYRGIALSGGKAAGKDTVMEYLMEAFFKKKTSHRIIRSKTPMVEAFEKSNLTQYDKSMDTQLMRFSVTARKNNPFIVSDYLWKECGRDNHVGSQPPAFTIIPDIRFIKENDMLMNNCQFFCIGIAASEIVRRRRIIQREGHDRNFNPLDLTEVEIPLLRNHYVVTNDGDTTEGLDRQLDIVLERYFSDYGF